MTDTTAQRITTDEFETMTDDNGQTVPNPKGTVQRWLAELELAAKAEKDYRSEVEVIRRQYRTESDKAKALTSEEASFNMLWSNTEIIVPSLYNSTPTPDVRRRFKDKDPVGKVTSTILERAISYEMDAQDFDGEILLGVLDFALGGRGVVRIRYRPEVQPVTPVVADTPAADSAAGEDPSQSNAAPPAAAQIAAAPSQEDAGAATGEAASENVESADAAVASPAAPVRERIVNQSTKLEHVQWNKFRRGPGKKWSDVTWVSFELDLSYDDLVEYFGKEIADKVPMTGLSDDQSEGMDKDSGVKNLFQSARVFEIWDKIQRRVLFIHEKLDAPLLEDKNPTLNLSEFFPMPKPAMAVLESGSLIPVPLYRQYKKQAEQIELMSQRIDKVQEAIKVKGAYLAAMPEVKGILDAGDMEMIAIEDAGTAVAQIGLDKAIWLMPLDKLVAALEALYKAREMAKQTIYEIIGLSDIMRGATQASETLGAQELKSRWGSIRLQRMQKEIQRWVRDLLRLVGEVIADHYEPDVLAQMTQVQLPTREQQQALKQQLAQVQQSAQQATQAAAQTGQPPPQLPPPPPEMQAVLDSPSWDDVMEVLRSDAMRQYRTNIETDSTITEILQRDMQGLAELLQQLGQLFASIPILMQSGASNGSEVVKEIALSVCRQARMGRSVEDSIETLDFKGGNMQMQQLGDAVKQIGGAVQQGAKQVQQLTQNAQQTNETLGKHQEMLGQIVKTLQSFPHQPPAAGPPPAPQGGPPGGPVPGAVQPPPMAA